MLYSTLYMMYIYSTENTEMNELNIYTKIITEIRNKEIPFISVTNSEWYSLFRDEIRNSIAIEGVFSNRSELLSVLEKGRKTTNQKTAAILGYFEAASSIYEYANMRQIIYGAILIFAMFKYSKGFISERKAAVD